jgi:hypothetical protein
MLTVLAFLFGTVTANADNSDCAMCHEDASMFEDYGERAASLTVTGQALENSAHEGLDCVDCHADLDGFDDYPHPETLEPVECGMCHDSEADIYQWHGRVKVGEGPDIPTCADCHGTHGILP